MLPKTINTITPWLLWKTRVIEEKDLTPEKLISEFDSLVADRETLVRLGRNAKKMAVENSSAMICDIIEKLAEKK